MWMLEMEANMVGSRMFKMKVRIWALQKGGKRFFCLFLMGRTRTERIKGVN